MQSTTKLKKKIIVIKSDINLIHFTNTGIRSSLLKKLHLNIHRIYYFYIFKVFLLV